MVEGDTFLINTGKHASDAQDLNRYSNQNPSKMNEARFNSCEEILQKDPPKCSVCGMVFRLTYLLTRHKYVHLTVKAFQCLYCGNRYQHYRGLFEHKRICNQNLERDSERIYTCSICGKGFDRKFSMTRHEAKHSNSKMHTCDFCRKAIEVKSSLITHKLICEKRDVAGKYFDCVQCGELFTSKYKLRRHCLSHSEEKSFKCQICNRPFKHKESLQRHHKKIISYY